MGIGDILQSPIVGTIAGQVAGSISTLYKEPQFFWKSTVLITPEDSSLPSVYFQFDPKWTENYSNNIQTFTPVRGGDVYPIYSSRAEDKFSLSSYYYARTKKEAETLEDFVESLRQISKAVDGELSVVGIQFPFKKELIRAYIESVNIEYSDNFIPKTGGSAGSWLADKVVGSPSAQQPLGGTLGSRSLNSLLTGGGGTSSDLPRKIDFSINFIKFIPLPSATSGTLSPLPASLNYDVSDTRRGDRNRGSSTGTQSDDVDFTKLVDPNYENPDGYPPDMKSDGT